MRSIASGAFRATLTIVPLVASITMAFAQGKPAPIVPVPPAVITSQPPLSDVGRIGCAQQFTGKTLTLGQNVINSNNAGLAANSIGAAAMVTSLLADSASATANAGFFGLLGTSLAGAGVATGSMAVVVDIPVVAPIAGAALGGAAAAAFSLAGSSTVDSFSKVTAWVGALSTVAGLGSQITAQVYSQQGQDLLSYVSTLPNCDSEFTGTVKVSGGGVNVTGASIFQGGDLGVTTNVIVGGTVTANSLSAANSITTDTLTATGLATTNGIANTGNIATTTLGTTAGAAIGTTLDVGADARIGGALTVQGPTTFNGATQLNNALSVAGLTSTNGIVNAGNITTTTLSTAGDAKIGTSLDVGANAAIAGTLTVGGSIAGGGASIHSTTGGSSLMVDANGARMSQGANTVAVNAGGVGLAGNGARLTLNGTTASLVNDTSHGLTVSSSQTLLTGGLSSTSLQLDDSGATFANAETGAPARVTGVANGTFGYDAVNYGQLRARDGQVSRGIAAATAMANIPPIDQGKTFAVGVGVGHFNGNTVLAVSGNYRASSNATFRASAALRGGRERTLGAGAAFSW